MFNSNSQVCFWAEYPRNCRDEYRPCDKDWDWNDLDFLFFLRLLLWPVISLLLMVVSMSMLSWKVYQTRQDMRRRFGESSINMDQVTIGWVQASLYVTSFALTRRIHFSAFVSGDYD